MSPCKWSVVRPITGVLDGPAPPRVGRLARARRHFRHEAALETPATREIRRLPHPRSHPGQRGRTQRGGLRHRGAKDLDVEDVGLEAAEEIIGGGAAVDAEGAEGHARLEGHGVEYVAALEGDGLEGRARDVTAAGAARDADEDAARIRVPVRRAEPGEGGHE